MAKRRKADEWLAQETDFSRPVTTDGAGDGTANGTPAVPGGLTADELAVLSAEADERRHAREEARKEKTAKTPRERFLSNAAKRVNKAVKAIDAVARVGNRKQYQYTEKEAEAIIDALTEAVSVACEAFDKDKKAEKGAFKLPVEEAP